MDVQVRDQLLSLNHYRITVESLALPIYAELKQAYDWLGHYWDEPGLQIELHESLRKVAPSTGDKIAFLKKFDVGPTTERAIEWAQANGYRLAFPWEREAFSKANPDLQREFWIIDLGSYFAFGSDRYVPGLGVDNDGRRGLVSDDAGDRWLSPHRFLFIREE